MSETLSDEQVVRQFYPNAVTTVNSTSDFMAILEHSGGGRVLGRGFGQRAWANARANLGMPLSMTPKPQEERRGNPGLGEIAFPVEFLKQGNRYDAARAFAKEMQSVQGREASLEDAFVAGSQWSAALHESTPKEK